MKFLFSFAFCEAFGEAFDLLVNVPSKDDGCRKIKYARIPYPKKNQAYVVFIPK